MPIRAKLKPPAKRVKKAKPKPKRRVTVIEARIRPEDIPVVERAAEIQGRTVSQFVAAATREAAHREVEQTHVIRLTVEQHRQFMEAIRKPPPLAPAMKRAIEHHRRLIGEP